MKFLSSEEPKGIFTSRQDEWLLGSKQVLSHFLFFVALLLVPP